MTQNSVTDEHLGKLAKRTGELTRRVREGTLNYNEVMSSLQKMIEGGSIRYSLEQKTFKTKIDYFLSPKQMVDNARCMQVDGSISKLFKVDKENGIHNSELVVICFNQIMHSSDILDEFTKMGVRPVYVPEFLALIAQHREVITARSLVTLEFSSKIGICINDLFGYLSVEHYDNDKNRTRLFLADFETVVWPASTRFVATKKKVTGSRPAKF